MQTRPREFISCRLLRIRKRTYPKKKVRTAMSGILEYSFLILLVVGFSAPALGAFRKSRRRADAPDRDETWF